MERTQKIQIVVDAAQDLRAENIVAIDVSAITSFADAFVIATGRSDRQVRAIADAIAKASKSAGEIPLGMEGHRDGRWVLIDLGDIIVHVFQPEARAQYDLERLWSDGTRVDYADPTEQQSVS